MRNQFRIVYTLPNYVLIISVLFNIMWIFLFKFVFYFYQYVEFPYTEFCDKQILQKY